MLADTPFIGFIPVRDLAKVRSFYTETLELRIVDDTPYALFLDAGGTMLRLTPAGPLTPRPHAVAGWTVPDIAWAVNALADSGVEFARDADVTQDELGIWTAPGGDRVAWFRDPDGNTLSLTEFTR